MGYSRYNYSSWGLQTNLQLGGPTLYIYIYTPSQLNRIFFAGYPKFAVVACCQAMLMCVSSSELENQSKDPLADS